MASVLRAPEKNVNYNLECRSLFFSLMTSPGVTDNLDK
jgi:hypothetical protein